MATYQLGKLPAKRDGRTLKLSSYLTPELPPPPESSTWSKPVKSWPMYANDQIGDCAIVTTGHMVKSWTCNADGEPRCVEPTPEQIFAEYRAVSGWSGSMQDPGPGCVVLDVLKRWKTVGLYGRKIGAYVRVDNRNVQTFCQAMHLFGGLYAGIQLPLAVQDMEIWRAPPKFWRRGTWRKGSWGGHAVYVVDYDRLFLTIATWGGLKKISWTFAEAYLDELWACVSEDWTNDAGKAPNGFDMPKLMRDLEKVR